MFEPPVSWLNSSSGRASASVTRTCSRGRSSSSAISIAVEVVMPWPTSARGSAKDAVPSALIWMRDQVRGGQRRVGQQVVEVVQLRRLREGRNPAAAAWSGANTSSPSCAAATRSAPPAGTRGTAADWPLQGRGPCAGVCGDELSSTILSTCLARVRGGEAARSHDARALVRDPAIRTGMCCERGQFSVPAPPGPPSRREAGGPEPAPVPVEQRRARMERGRVPMERTGTRRGKKPGLTYRHGALAIWPLRFYRCHGHALCMRGLLA